MSIAPVRAADPTPEEVEFFEKSVRPVLVENCFKCHSSDGKKKGGLLADSRAALLEGGDNGPALVPGKPDDSRLVEAIRYTNVDLRMPPRGKLTNDEIAALTKWVAIGAPWPGGAAPAGGSKPSDFNLQERARHWSFQPLRQDAPPAVKQAAWPRSDVDRFILAALEAKGLQPAPVADKRTLLRRVTFDLIGLPPTPAEIDAFLADESPEAFARVVDRLLDSPHYGERWARHWLDLVRYAETAGHEFDFDIPEAYVYRDYVIRAFNADVPYDQFVREHVAGDLLEEPRRHPTLGFDESIIGTGFFWLGEGKHSPVDIRDEEANRVDNQIDVFAKTFLGLTVSCARCHDHKFDAITTKDYYALAGFLQSSHRQMAFIDDPAPATAALERLDEAQTAYTEALQQTVLPRREAQAAEIDRYLLAAAELLPNRLVQTEQALAGDLPLDAKGADVVFADFEQPTYSGWTATGDAFGTRPNRMPVPTYQGELGERGNGFVNSHSALHGDERKAGDQLTGTLTSPPFKIERKGIRFLIGGGNHAGRTCLNLLIDGEVRRTATGKNQNRMEWAELDVAEFLGQEARLQIVDNEKGGWGNIGVDEITFTDNSGAGRERQIIDLLARQRKGLDPAALARWVAEQKLPALADPTHPLYPWLLIANSADATTTASFERNRNAVAATLRDRVSAAEANEVFEDFSDTDYGEWRTTGDAFGIGPAQAEDVVRKCLEPRTDPRAWVTGAAHSGMQSPRLQGVLRSPTFTIESDRIWYRIAGRNCRVNLVIDEFHFIRDPIYGGLTFTPSDPERLKWHGQNVQMWQGHRAYIEVIDDGDGEVALEQVVFGDARQPVDPPNALVLELLEDPEIHSLTELAAGYRRVFAEALELPTGETESHRAEHADLATWLLGSAALGGLEATLAVLPAAERATLTTLRAKRDELAGQVPLSRRALALTDGTPENEHVFIRGSHKHLGDEVPRRFLEALGGLDEDEIIEGSGRLELAERMLAPSDPLVPRVIVNRVWQHHFGTGIVATPDDFGKMGQPPTHPELLDFLAQQFVADGWSLKRLHRRLLLTSTWQMSSVAEPRAEEADPNNRLLHRMPIQRLEAETIRDAVLAVSGRLQPELFGRSVLPNLTPFMIGRGRPASGPLDGDGRRSIYLNVRRNFLNPMFLAFDYPIPFSTMGRRSVSNVPAQALSLMNNPFVTQQAELWAQRLLKTPQPAEERISQMYVAAFARPPSETELAQALEFVEGQSKQYGGSDPPQAWTDLCHVLFNVKEFIFIN